LAVSQWTKVIKGSALNDHESSSLVRKLDGTLSLESDTFEILDQPKERVGQSKA
jgi:hypothetical protein